MPKKIMIDELHRVTSLRPLKSNNRVISSNSHELLLQQFSEVLQDTYGVIQTIFSGEIYALVYTHDDEFLEDITFDVSEFPDEDIELTGVGSVFYWIVGYIGTGDDRTEASELRIRRFQIKNSMGQT